MTPGERGAGRLVYVVDDELLLAQIMEAILKMEGFQVRMFSSPKEALEAARQEPAPPALLVTDFAMEPLTGLELLAQIRELNPGLRSVMVSGNAGAEVFENSPVLPDAFLEKPFLPKKLVQAIEAILEPAA
jgi:two-component system, cell cycle sensor histidine kinase and response regulator CckA